MSIKQGTNPKDIHSLLLNVNQHHAKERQRVSILQDIVGPTVFLPAAFDLPKAIKAIKKEWLRVLGATSKYQHHQGERECARRRRQGARDAA